MVTDTLFGGCLNMRFRKPIVVCLVAGLTAAALGLYLTLDYFDLPGIPSPNLEHYKIGVAYPGHIKVTGNEEIDIRKSSLGAREALRLFKKDLGKEDSAVRKLLERRFPKEKFPDLGIPEIEFVEQHGILRKPPNNGRTATPDNDEVSQDPNDNNCVQRGATGSKLGDKGQERHPVDLAEYFSNECDEGSGTVAVIGHPATWRLVELTKERRGKSTSALDVYEEHELCLITPQATNPDIFSNYNGIFTMMYDDSWLGSMISAYLSKCMNIEKKNVLVVYQEDKWGQDLLGSYYESKKEERKHKDNIVCISTEILDGLQAIQSEESQKSLEGKGLIEAEARILIEADVGNLIEEEVLRKSLVSRLEESAPSKRVEAIVLFVDTKISTPLVKGIRSRRHTVPIVGTDALAKSGFAAKLEKIKKDLEKNRRETGETKPLRNSLNILVANPFYYSLASFESQRTLNRMRRQFTKEYRGLRPKPNKEDEDNHYGKQPQVELPPSAALWYDAAFLLTVAIMEHEKNKVEGRQYTLRDKRRSIREELEKLRGPENGVQSLSGTLYFPPKRNGAMQRDVLFSWVENGGFVPAYTQLLRKRSDGNTSEDRHDDRTGKKDSIKCGENEVLVKGECLNKVKVVFTGVDFYRINEIDLAEQRFDAEFFVWFRWKDDPNERKRFGIVPELDRADKSKLFFWNGVHGMEDKVDLLEHRTMHSDGSTVTALKVKSTFVAEYELAHYPFDHQKLGIEMSLANCATDCVLLAFDENAAYHKKKDVILYPKEYTESRESEGGDSSAGWEYQQMDKVLCGTKPMDSSFGDRNVGMMDLQGPEYSVFHTRLNIQRNPRSYLIKMFIPLVVLMCISLFAFWVKPDHFDVRIQLSLTALLATIVFHLTRAEALPNVGYATLADLYFILAYGLMLINTGMVIFIKTRKEERAEFWSGIFRFVSHLSAVFAFGFLTVYGLGENYPWLAWCLAGLVILWISLNVLWYWRGIKAYWPKLLKSIEGHEIVGKLPASFRNLISMLRKKSEASSPTSESPPTPAEVLSEEAETKMLGEFPSERLRQRSNPELTNRISKGA